MRTFTKDELKEILDLHKKWLNKEAGGCRADLSSANLSRADLRYADLSYAIGEMGYVKSLQCEKYYISYTHTHMNIGCQSHTITGWQDFDDDAISKMDKGALEWWSKWKPIIMNIIEVSPALESEVENEVK